MTEILSRAMNIAERIRNMQDLNTIGMVFFSIILVFGIVNCILGYRLLRFWMMLFGFMIGAGLGFFGVYQYGSQEKSVYIVAMVAAGVALAVVAFLIFRAGIFIIGAGLGLTISIYLIHPTSSAAFFLCMLIGVGIGVVAIRYAKEVIIVGTSLLGGVLAGMSLAKIAGLAEFPYGIGMSAGFAILSLLIQFAINKTKYIDDDDEYDDDYEDAYDERYGDAHDRRYRDEYAYGYDDNTRDYDDYNGKTRRSRREYGYDEEPRRSRREYGYDEEPRQSRKEYNYDDDLADYELYATDEEEIIEEYLDDYYGENKKRRKPEPVNSGTAKKRQKTSGTKAKDQKTKSISDMRKGTQKEKNTSSEEPVRKKAKKTSARPETQRGKKMSIEDLGNTDFFE